VTHVCVEGGGLVHHIEDHDQWLLVTLLKLCRFQRSSLVCLGECVYPCMCLSRHRDFPNAVSYCMSACWVHCCLSGSFFDALTSFSSKAWSRQTERQSSPGLDSTLIHTHTHTHTGQVQYPLIERCPLCMCVVPLSRCCGRRPWHDGLLGRHGGHTQGQGGGLADVVGHRQEG